MNPVQYHQYWINMSKINHNFGEELFYDQSDIFDPYNKKFLTKGIIHPDRSIQDRVKTV